jgi:hypothetical protein
MKWFLLIVLSSFQTTAHSQDSASVNISIIDSVNFTVNTESIGYILNDTLLFSDSINRISFYKHARSTKNLRKYFNSKKKRRHFLSTPINLTPEIEAIYIEDRSKYSGNYILFSKDDKTILLHLSPYCVSLFGYKSFKNKPFCIIYRRSISFSNMDEIYYLNYGHSQDDEYFENLTISQVFNLIDDPKYIKQIELPVESERTEQIQLR